MRNPDTGDMEPISEDLYDKIKELKDGQFVSPETFRDGTPIPSSVVTFKVGEELEVRGSVFRVHRIKRKDITLRRVWKG